MPFARDKPKAQEYRNFSGYYPETRRQANNHQKKSDRVILIPEKKAKRQKPLLKMKRVVIS